MLGGIQGWLMAAIVAAAVLSMLIGIKFAGRGAVFDDGLSLHRSKAVKGIFAILIVFHHLSIEIHNAGIVEAFSNIGYLAVAVFFFYSGYGLLKSFREKPDYMKGFLLRRLPEVLVPFWLTNVLYLAVFALGNVKMSALDVVSYLFGFRLINEYAWFILVILLFYIAFYFMFRFLPENKAFWGMGIFTLILIAGCLFLHVDNWWYNSCIALFIGMVWARYERNICAYFQKKTWFKLALSFVVFVLGFSVAPRIIEGSGLAYADVLRTVVQIATVVLFLFCFIPFGMKVKLQNRWLILAGNAALEIYLIQRLVLLSLKPVGLFGLRPMTWIQSNPALYAALTLVLTIGLGLLLHAGFQAILKPYRKHLLQNK